MNAAIEAPALAECGVIPPEVWKSMRGLDLLHAIIVGKLPAPPIAGLIGFYLAEAGEGTATFAGVPEFRHYNPAGAVHGGYAGVLLDSAMTCAVQTTLEAGWGCVTLEYKISLVRAMTKDTGLVRAVGKVINTGKRTASAEGSILDGQGKVLAHGTTTCLVFQV